MFNKMIAAIAAILVAGLGSTTTGYAVPRAAAGANAGVKKPTEMPLVPLQYSLAIVPRPQRAFSIGPAQMPFRFDSNTVLWAMEPRDRPGVEMLAADLKKRFGLTVAVIDGPAPKFEAASRVIRFERNAGAQRSAQYPFLERLQTPRAEGYCLVAEKSGIVVRGQDQRGVLYGVQTLRQLVRDDQTVAPLAIQDWPEMPWRMLYGYYTGPLNTLADVENHVQQAVLLKANMIIWESPWSASANWWFNPTGDRKLLGDRFFEACRRYGIEPIPLIQGPGWGYGVTDRDPMASEAEWRPADPHTLYVSKPTRIAKANVVRTESAPIIVTDVTGKTRYTEGKDYSVVAGDTSRPYNETNAPWLLQALAGGAIAEGTKVVVSYNYVTPNYHKAYCLSEPRSYKIVDEAIDSIMTTQKPNVIHIGHDEVWELATDSRCKDSGYKPEELVYRDLMHWYNRVKSHNPKAVIMVWDDLFRRAPKGEITGPLAFLVHRIPKDIVLCPWYYYAKPSAPGDIAQRLQSQTDMGFPVIGVPSGYWMTNSYLWHKELQPYLKNGKSTGLMFTAWGEGLSGAALPPSMELMWSGNTVDKAVFDNYEKVMQCLKDQNIGLTYEFSRLWQKDAIAKLFNDSIKAGKTPAGVAQYVTNNLVGDTALFERAYGKQQWATIAHDAPFTIQQASMLRKIPRLFQLFADYFEAKACYDGGDPAAGRTQLEKVIDELHAIGYLSYEETQQLKTSNATQWLSPKELFGLELTAPATKAAG